MDISGYGGDLTDDELVDSGPTFSPTDFGNADQATLMDAGRRSGGGVFGIAGTLGGLAYGATIGLADQVSSSIGLTDRGSIDRGIANIAQPIASAIGLPNINQWYADNQGAIEIGGAISTVLVTDGIAAGLLSKSGRAMQLLGKSPIGARVAGLDDAYAASLSRIQMVDEAGAAAAGIGSEAATLQIALPEYSKTNAFVTTTRKEAVNAFRRVGYEQAAYRAATQEALIAATANSNSFLWADDAGTNIAFAGLGIGGAAAISRFTGQYAIRKLANSDTSNRAAQKALDPLGTEQARIQTGLTSALENPDSRLGELAWDRGRFSDMATSYSLSAAESANPKLTENAGLFSRRTNLATKFIGQAQSEIGKVTTEGLSGVRGSSFSMAEPEASAAIQHAIYKDPLAMYGVGALGKVPVGETIESITKKHADHIAAQYDELANNLAQGGITVPTTMKDPKTGLRIKTTKVKPFTPEERKAHIDGLAHTRFLASRDLFALVDGEPVSIATAKLFDDVKPIKPIKETSDNEFSIWEVPDRKVGEQIGIDSYGQVYTPGDMPVGELPLNDSLSLFKVADTAINGFVNSKTMKLVLGKDATWLQYDMAEEILKRSGDETKVVFPQGMTREMALGESFKLKALEIEPKLKNADEDMLQLIRYQYNLPRLSAYERGLFGTSEHPAEIIMRGIKNDTPMTTQDIMEGIQSARNLTGMASAAKSRADEISGNMFKFGFDNQGRPLGVVIGARRPLAPFEWTKDTLAERLAMQKVAFVEKLGRADSPEFSRTITQQVVNDPNLPIASQVDKLREVQLESAVPGFDSKGIGGDLVTREWLNRDNPIMQAAYKLRDQLNRFARAAAQAQIDGAIGPVLKELNAPGNKSSRLLTDRLLSHRAGWDLKTTGKGRQLVTADEGNGLKSYILDDTEANKSRWRRQFGSEMPAKDAKLTGPDGKLLVIDNLGQQFMTQFNKVSGDLQRNKNTIRAAQGLPPINEQILYTPPPSLKNKYVGFTLDAANRPVPGGTVIASSEREFNQMVAALSDPTNPLAPIREGSGNAFYSRDEITDFDTLWDQAQRYLQDSGVTPLQVNQRAKGLLTGQSYNPNAVEDAILWARDGYLKHAGDIFEGVMDSSIKAAKARAALVTPRTKNAIGREEATSNSVFDHWINNIKGRQQIDSPGSTLGQISRPIIDKINRILEDKGPKAAGAIDRAVTAAKEFNARYNPAAGTDAVANLTYNKIAAELGPHMPFKSVSDMIERQSGAKRPADISDITGQMSRYEAFMRLRAFETLHPIMNMAGIIASSPAVIRSMQKLTSETAEEHVRRIGHLGTVMNTNKGQIGMLNSGKLIASALKDAWNIKALPEYDRWQKLGYITQEVAEFNKQMSVANTRDGWKAAFFGDPRGANEYQRMGLTGMVSALSDRSEDLTRGWAHVIGDRLGKHLGITNDKARDSFAHDFANKTIANYDPVNRPAVFQGPLGAPIGLFQSFAVNYYQRIFRYLETGENHALATQLATQSVLFGVHTVPGYDQVNALVNWSTDGKTDIGDKLYSRVDPFTHDLLFNGTLGNLPQLVGLPGVDLSGRGDSNFRVPGFQGLPIMDSMGKAFDGVRQGIDMFWTNRSHLTAEHIAEVATNMLTNRPMAGFIEQLGAGGFDTDASGQIVTDTANGMESVYRIMGGRSTRQAAEVDAFYRNKNAQAMQGVKMDNLRNAYRAEIRGGGNPDPEKYFADYVAAGGDPRRYNQWIRNQEKPATQTRSQRMADKFAKSGNDPELLQRLLDAGIEIDQSTADSQRGNPYKKAEEPMYETNPGEPDAFATPSAQADSMDPQNNTLDNAMNY